MQNYENKLRKPAKSFSDVKTLKVASVRDRYVTSYVLYLLHSSPKMY